MAKIGFQHALFIAFVTVNCQFQITQDEHDSITEDNTLECCENKNCWLLGGGWLPGTESLCNLFKGHGKQPCRHCSQLPEIKQLSNDELEPRDIDYEDDLVPNDKYIDCAEIKRKKPASETGNNYTLTFPDMGNKNVTVRCDMKTEGGGWTVFQRRGQHGNPQNFFYKNWSRYTNGFGDPNKEHWLGLKYIRAISNHGDPQTLLIKMTDDSGVKKIAKYEEFSVNDDDYKLHIKGYSGDAGDSFSVHNGRPFNTHDKHESGYKCAKTYKGAWWYAWCHYSNLNGMNYNGKHTTWADGINWYGFRGFYNSLKRTTMQMRPKDFQSGNDDDDKK